MSEDRHQLKPRKNIFIRFAITLKQILKKLCNFIVIKSKKLKKVIKKTYRKLKYLDRVDARFYLGITVLSLFCLFVGGTYSYFNFGINLDSAFITVASLKYTLTSDNERFQDYSVTLAPKETLELTLDLKSFNEKNSKYALNYSCESNDVEVYYVDKREQNVIGEIGTRNSIINMKIAIENNSDAEQVVKFELKGGFLKNVLTSNITAEFYNGLIVTFNPTGGTVSTAEISLEAGTETYGELPIPIKTNYIFLGWFTEQAKGTRIKSTTTINSKGKQTLYAHWGENSSSTEMTQIMNLKVNEGDPDFSKIAPAVATYKDEGFNSNKYSDSIRDSYIYSDAYVFDPKGPENDTIYGGSYTLINPQKCNSKTECASVLKGKYITDFYGSSYGESTTNIHDIYLVEDVIENTLYYKHPQRSRDSYDDSTNGIWSAQDGLGTTYYFRGNIKNNYVKFANFYWRIIRISGDGSIKIIYDGTTAHANGEESTDRYISSSHWISDVLTPDAKYVGYMFGGSYGKASDKRVEYNNEGHEDSLNSIYNSVSSSIKWDLDMWYMATIEKDYGLYVDDQIFCNDRTIYNTNKEDYYKYGYGRVSTYYQGYKLRAGEKPTYICPDINDSFSVKASEKGNGKLEYPIGLISADEVFFAGALVSGNEKFYNNQYYLYKGNSFWTGTPYNNNYLYIVGQNGVLDANYGSTIYNTNGIAPVISLKSAYFKTLIGDGTMENPYREEGSEA